MVESLRCRHIVHNNIVTTVSKLLQRCVLLVYLILYAYTGRATAAVAQHSKCQNTSATDRLKIIFRLPAAIYNIIYKYVRGKESYVFSTGHAVTRCIILYTSRCRRGYNNIIILHIYI